MEVAQNKSFVFIAVLAVLFGFGSSQTLPCPEDYSPCYCRDEGQGLVVVCNNVALSEVKSILGRTSTLDLNILSLSLPSADRLIPSDLLVDKRTLKLEIGCTNDVTLVIDPNAFRSTRGFTETIHHHSCNVTDLAFLEGFARLKDFSMDFHPNIGSILPNLPSLPSLSILAIEFCRGWNSMVGFPKLAHPLSSFSIYNNNAMDTATVDRILTEISLTSAESLESLDVSFNRIKSFPQTVSIFRNVKVLRLSYNTLSVIRNGSLPSFSNPVTSLSLYNGQIESIEPGSFQGIFAGAKVDLAGNNLTKFEASVFQTMLEQMVQSNGTLDLSSNPFDCNEDRCNLAWLVRDNRHLLPPIKYARCSINENSVLFENLDPQDFVDCPLTGPFVCQEDGIFADPQSCKSFYICINLEAYLNDCPTDTVFNPVAEKCDTPANVDQCFTCYKGNGFYSIPNDCSSYYFCSNNVAAKRICPSGLVFNPLTDQCDYCENVPSCGC